jgi:hypothetical protein
MYLYYTQIAYSKQGTGAGGNASGPVWPGGWDDFGQLRLQYERGKRETIRGLL